MQLKKLRLRTQRFLTSVIGPVRTLNLTSSVLNSNLELSKLTKLHLLFLMTSNLIGRCNKVPSRPLQIVSAFRQSWEKIRYWNRSAQKRSASESKRFQIECRPNAQIPRQVRREERLSRSKLKQLFLIGSYPELSMYLIEGIRLGS